MTTLFFAAAIASIISFTVGFFLAFHRKRIDVVDIYWGISFATIAATLFLLTPQHTPTMYLATLLIFLWAFRLSGHVSRRFARSKEQDPRYTELTSQWPRRVFWLQIYFRIFILQALLALVVIAPLVVIASSATFSWFWCVAGGIVWATGFLFESVGDQQLATFLAQPKNRDKLMTSGLWRYTRHPNYFGELTMWWGIWLLSVGMSGWWLAVIGPITISLLLRYVSGVPLAEKRSSGKQGWGDYAKRTPVLLPTKFWR